MDSKSTASDGVPVRVRPPAPKYGIPEPGIPYFNTGRTRTGGESPGSEGSTAGGGTSDPSEWQWSAGEEAAPSATKMPGTATGRRHQSPKGVSLWGFALYTRKQWPYCSRCFLYCRSALKQVYPGRGNPHSGFLGISC